MGERAKKKRAADAKAARLAKKAAEAAEKATTHSDSIEYDPASTDHDPGPTSSDDKRPSIQEVPTIPTSSDDKLVTRSNARNSKAAAAPRVPSSLASTRHSSDSTRSLGASSTLGSVNKTGTAPRIPSLASTRHSTRSLTSSKPGSVTKNCTSADVENHNDESITTRPQRSATAAAKVLLQQLQFSENETDFEEDPDGGSNNEIMELDDDEDEGGESFGSDIELVEDGKIEWKGRKGGPKVVPAASRSVKKKPAQAIDEGESSSGEFDDEFGEFV
jgi:hypothetical protein